MNELTETEKAYIAGFFDGEGCISITKYQGKNNRTPVYTLQVVVGQKTSMLHDLYDLVGIGSISVNKRHAKSQDYLQWSMSAKDATKFLEMILPYLRGKAEEARIAIEFQSKQGHKLSGGKGWTVPQEMIDEKEHYRLALQNLKGFSGGKGRLKR